MNSLKVGEKLDFKITEINHNNIVVKKGEKEAFLYEKEMPKVTVEIVVVDEDNKHIVLLEEDIDGVNKLVLPGDTLQNDESSGEAGVRILKNYVGVEFETGDLELYDFRTNPDRDHRQWAVSVIYIARLKYKKEEFWATIRDVILQESDFGYDHHRIIQNFEYNC